MTKGGQPHFLKLVHSSDAPQEVAGITSSNAAFQESWILDDTRSILVFIPLSQIDEDELKEAFERSKPQFLIDLRIAPRFDIGNFNRKSFLNYVEASGCQYFDIFGRLNIRSNESAETNPDVIASYLNNVLARSIKSGSTRVTFFLDDALINDDYIDKLSKAIIPPRNEKWTVYRHIDKGTGVPQNTPTVADSEESNVSPLRRETVFISHAAVEKDNEFVRWLSGKLSLAGFRVWSDLAELKGGDTFWKDIETAIRDHAVKVLVVHSAAVKSADGVRKEVYLSLRIAKQRRSERFVVPLRIDSTPFDETFIELIDIQAIDFKDDWHRGLQAVLALLQHDKVPQIDNITTGAFLQWIDHRKSKSSGIADELETLTSNWLSIEKFPTNIHFYLCEGIGKEKIPSICSSLKIPCFPYERLIGTFASLDVLAAEIATISDDVALVHRASLTTKDFLDAKCGDLPSWKRGEARKHLFSMLRKSWTAHIAAKGTKKAIFANNKDVAFFPNQILQDNKVTLVGPRGKSMRRNLVGFSKKRSVYWHYGLEAKPILADGYNFALKGHVIFSTDGTTPVPGNKGNVLRRGFCKSWWNDRWRDLMSAYLWSISDGQDFFEMNVGGVEPILVAAKPMLFEASVTIADDKKIIAEETTEEDFEFEDEADEDVDQFEIIELENMDNDNPDPSGIQP